MILVMALIFVLILVVDVFGFEFATTSTHSYFVLSDLQVNRKDSLDLAKDYLGSSSTRVLPKTQEERKYTLLTMFKTRDGSDILQPANVADYIEFITTTNNLIPDTDADDYYSFCLADPTDPYSSYPDCSSQAVWDPVVATFGANPGNVTQDDLDEFIDSHLNNPYTVDAFLSCFEEGFVDGQHSQFYRCAV